jgi:hypothetical protein
MTKRLLVGFLVVAALAGLTACGGATLEGADSSVESAPVELEVASPAKSEAAPVYNELLDPEFGCNGGGHLEYGLVDRPDLD